jgi:hypothetical protein
MQAVEINRSPQIRVAFMEATARNPGLLLGSLACGGPTSAGESAVVLPDRALARGAPWLRVLQALVTSG